ncbi:DUF2577 domain-containing protein [Paenibacillus sp. FSL R5-0887]|jgi:hypothetical protein|uniref:DUF2577 domain-containing protein n=1 Tax=Paenibacillus sp. FSL R5-0887 TaxID=2921662 RepID=UPI0030F96C37
MLDAIKQAAVEAINAAGPVIVQLAVITNENPLEVLVDNRLSLSEDFLIVPEKLSGLKVTIGAQEVEIRKALAVGDKLLLIRMQGGQRYVIMDRVVSV